MGPLDGPWLDQFDDDGDVDGGATAVTPILLTRAGDAITTSHPARAAGAGVDASPRP